MSPFRNPAAVRVVADAVDVAAVAIGAGDVDAVVCFATLVATRRPSSLDVVLCGAVAAVGAVGRCWLLWAECLVPIDVLPLMLVSLPFPCSCHAASCEASLCIESMV